MLTTCHSTSSVFRLTRGIYSQERKNELENAPKREVRNFNDLKAEAEAEAEASAAAGV